MASRYSNINIRKTEEGKRIYSQFYSPDIPYSEDDIYIITTSLDRYDLISLDFWGDVSYWYYIPIINNLECDSIFPPTGIQLRIPNNIENIINIFNEENR